MRLYVLTPSVKYSISFDLNILEATPIIHSLKRDQKTIFQFLLLFTFYHQGKNNLWSKFVKNLTINVHKFSDYSPALFLKNLKNSESGDKTIEVSDSPIAAR